MQYWGERALVDAAMIALCRQESAAPEVANERELCRLEERVGLLREPTLSFCETLEGLAATIHTRRDASPETSYTARLLTDVEDELLKKIAEEASEVIMACKDDDHDHIRYEAGDLVYHLLVILERYGVTLDELAGELNARMK